MYLSVLAVRMCMVESSHTPEQLRSQFFAKSWKLLEPGQVVRASVVGDANYLCGKTDDPDIQKDSQTNSVDFPTNSQNN